MAAGGMGSAEVARLKSNCSANHLTRFSHPGCSLLSMQQHGVHLKYWKRWKYLSAVYMQFLTVIKSGGGPIIQTDWHTA